MTHRRGRGHRPGVRGEVDRRGCFDHGELLERGAKPSGRQGLADATGISPTLILEWVNHADLWRIKGVGSEYSDLLEAAGVDSPAELAQRNAANLAITFQELDAARPNMDPPDPVRGDGQRLDRRGEDPAKDRRALTARGEPQ